MLMTMTMHVLLKRSSCRPSCSCSCMQHTLSNGINERCANWL